VLLEVPENLPPKEQIQRWLGEPVKALVLPTSVFQTNKRGFPTLSKAHQDLLLLFFRHNVQVKSQSLQSNPYWKMLGL
jgi:protein arginine N-methyltransferase 5